MTKSSKTKTKTKTKMYGDDSKTVDSESDLDKNELRSVRMKKRRARNGMDKSLEVTMQNSMKELMDSMRTVQSEMQSIKMGIKDLEHYQRKMNKEVSQRLDDMQAAMVQSQQLAQTPQRQSGIENLSTVGMLFMFTVI